MVAIDTPTEKQAIGIRDGRLMKIVCAFDVETWHQVRGMAVENKISVAEQVRRLVEIGLEGDIDLEAVAKQADRFASDYDLEAIRSSQHQVRTVPEGQLARIKSQHWRIIAKFIRSTLG